MITYQENINDHIFHVKVAPLLMLTQEALRIASTVVAFLYKNYLVIYLTRKP
jgi:hypothetical protein